MQPFDPQAPNPSASGQTPFNAPQSPYGAPQPPYGGPPAPVPGADKKLPAGLCGLLLGGFGVHKFVLGYTNEGLIMLAASVLTCFTAYPIVHIIGIIEGIVYLTKTDAQFVQEYVQNKKPWF